MFVETWRKHWGLSQDPFACEDADKDSILSRMDLEAVHSGFERLFGDPASPAPGIVFGEKGSGKSGLRLMTRRWLERFNAENAEARIFVIDYVDFDSAIESFQRRIGVDGASEEAARRVLDQWEVADHLDAIRFRTVSRPGEELCGPQPSQTDRFLVIVRRKTRSRIDAQDGQRESGERRVIGTRTAHVDDPLLKSDDRPAGRDRHVLQYA